MTYEKERDEAAEKYCKDQILEAGRCCSLCEDLALRVFQENMYGPRAYKAGADWLKNHWQQQERKKPEDFWRAKYYDKCDDLNRAEKKVQGLVEALEDADKYLSVSPREQIGSGSMLHRQMKEALEDFKKDQKNETTE